jgi:hypothetical protein
MESATTPAPVSVPQDGQGRAVVNHCVGVFLPAAVLATGKASAWLPTNACAQQGIRATCARSLFVKVNVKMAESASLPIHASVCRDGVEMDAVRRYVAD